MPSFESTETRSRDDDVIQPPRPFAPTPTPDITVSMSHSREVPPSGEKETKKVDEKQSNKEKRADILRTQRIRLEPVRMPIPRLQNATSTSSLQQLQDSTASNASQLKDGKPNLLGLKKAHSNVDVAPSSHVKPLPLKRQSQPAVKLPSKCSVLKNAPSQPLRRTISPGSVKDPSPSPLSSPQRRGSSERATSPDQKGSGVSRTSTSPPSPSEGSEVGSDHDLLSPGLSSSSEGEVKMQCSCHTRHGNLK